MTTTLRLNDCLKKDCDAVLDDIGLSFSAAITIFMREVVRTGAIPFPLCSPEILAEYREVLSRDKFRFDPVTY